MKFKLTEAESAELAALGLVPFKHESPAAVALWKRIGARIGVDFYAADGDTIPVLAFRPTNTMTLPDGSYMVHFLPRRCENPPVLPIDAEVGTRPRTPFFGKKHNGS